jgi:hypothetical protein
MWPTASFSDCEGGLAVLCLALNFTLAAWFSSQSV